MNMQLNQLIMNANDLPTIPVVATKVLQLIESETTTSEDLAKVVSSDSAVAARILKISNSSFFGCKRQINTLSHAIMMLGYNTLKSLVMAASVKQVSKTYGLTEKMLWEHSFGAGLAARIIADATQQVNTEEAFLGGLFHDIGKTIMNNIDRQQFQMVMQKCYNDNVSFQKVEQEFYPYTHADVGGLVIEKWNFPEILMKAILEHHRFNFAENEDPYQVSLTCIVGLANLFCHKIGLGQREPEQDLVLHESIPARILNLDEEQLAALTRLVLENKGYRVLSANDGAEALDVFGRHAREIDLVVTDLGLPKLNGWEAYLKMKRIRPDVSTIIATGYTDPKSKSEMLESGVKQVVLKPFMPNTLLQVVRETLDAAGKK